MVDKITSFVARDGVEGDKEFFLSVLNEIYERFQRVNSLKLELNGTQSLSAAGEAVKKTRKEMDEMAQMTLQAVQALEKLKAAQSEEAKALAIQKEALRLQNQELRNAAKESLAAENSIDKLRATLSILTAKKNRLDIDTTEYKDAEKEVLALTTRIKELEAASGDFRRNVGNYQGSAKIIVDALKDVEDKITSLREKQTQLQNFSAGNPIGFKLGGGDSNLNQVTAELKQLEKEAEALNNITADPQFFNIAGKVGDARTEIRGFTTQLVKLEQEGLGSSQFAIELRQRLAELTDAVGDAKAEIKALSSDTRQLDLVAGSLSFLTSTYQTALGASALFGDETEELQKSMQKLIAVQTFASGVQQVANELTTRGTAANKVYAWTQGLIATATNASATATARLAAATKLLGIGLLVGAIAFIAIKYQEWAKAAADAGKNQKLLNTIANNAADSYGQEKARLDVLVASIQEEGKTRKEKFETLKQLQEAYPGYFDNIKTEADLNDKLAEAYERAAKGILLKASANAAESLLSENISKGLKARVEFERKERELALQNVQDLQLSSDKDYNEQLKKLQQLAAKTRSEALGKDLTDIDKENKFLLQQIIDSNKQIEALGGKTKATTEDKDPDAARKALFELEKQRLEEQIKLQKEASDSYLAGLSARIAARTAAFEKERELAKLEQDFAIGTADRQKTEALKNTKLSEKERVDTVRAADLEILKAREGYAAKVKDLEKQTAGDIIAIRAKIAADEKKKRDDDLAYAGNLGQSTLQREINAAQKAFEKRISLIETQATEEQQINLRTYEKGRISKEDFERNKAEIETKYRRASLLAEIDYNERLLQLVDLAPDAKAAAEKKLSDLKKQLRDQDLKDEQEGYDRSVEAARKRNEKLSDLANELKETTFTFITAGIDRQKESVQEQLDLLEKKKQRETEIVQQTVTNQTQAAEQIALIEARAAAQKEQLERRKRQLDEQRARWERVKNIADIIQSTSIAVVGALGAKPWTPANIALAAIVGAIGAAQIARVLATPIPKFFRGKDKNNPYEGPGIVGDGGKSEAIIREDGSVEITPDKPTLTYIGKRDVILPDARQLADQQFAMAINAAGRLVAGYTRDKTPENKDLERAMDRMGARFEKAIQNIPQPHYTTLSPIEQWLKSGSSWQKFIGGRR